MTREYFLAESLDDADQVVELLDHRLHIADNQIHVLSKDLPGVRQHHLHPATLWQRSDLLRCAEQGALVGVVVGLSLFCTALLGTPFWTAAVALKQVLLLALFLAPVLLAALIGAGIGLRRQSYKLRRFYQQLEAGRHLILVDADRQTEIRQLLRQCPVQDLGEDRTEVWPFDADDSRGLEAA